MTSLIARVGILLILFALVGTPRAQAAPAQQATLPPEMTGVEWALVSLQPAGAAAEDTTGLGLSLLLGTDGSASGSGGCNGFFTGYTAGDAQSLTFSVIAGTLIGCEEPISKREFSYFQILQDVATYSLADGRLTLTSAAGGELIYAAPQAAAPTTPAPPAQLPSTGGEGLAPLWLALAAAASLYAGLRLRRAARTS